MLVPLTMSFAYGDILYLLNFDENSVFHSLYFC